MSGRVIGQGDSCGWMLARRGRASAVGIDVVGLVGLGRRLGGLLGLVAVGTRRPFQRGLPKKTRNTWRLM